MAQCCNSSSDSAQQIQTCIERSSQKVQYIQKVLESEMSEFQNRLNRCSMQCQDEVNDKYRSADGRYSNQSAAEAMMLKCAGTCIDRHLAMLPAMRSKLEKEIDKVKNS